jgi:hypothetical protein
MTQQLQQRLQRKIDLCAGSIEKFKLELDKDPAHALSWSNGVFSKAAEHRVLKIVLSNLESDSTIENVKSYLMECVLHRSKYPAQSTSPTSNLIEQYELAAYAELLSELQFYK